MCGNIKGGVKVRCPEINVKLGLSQSQAGLKAARMGENIDKNDYQSQIRSEKGQARMKLKVRERGVTVRQAICQKTGR